MITGGNMNGIDLEKSIEKLKSCYIGKVKGTHTLDKSKVSNLEFDFAMYRINLGLKNKELTKKQFTKRMKK